MKKNTLILAICAITFILPTNLEAQSFLFKKGLENHKKRSLELSKKWEKIRADINSLSTDGLISELNYQYNQLKIFKEKKNYSTIDFLALASLKSKIATIEEFISVKTRVKEVFEIDYYLKNEDELLILLGYEKQTRFNQA